MPRFCFRSACAATLCGLFLCALALSATAAARADDPPQSSAGRALFPVETATKTRRGDDPTVGADGRSVLLLNNGRVVAGRLGQNAGGYMVQTGTGSMLVPFEHVRLRAADLPDAYRRLLASFPNPSPDTHVALARWCLTQQLFDETTTELRSALSIDPNHAEARNMLRRLEEILNPQDERHQPDEAADAQADDGFKPPPARALAGLSREAAFDFVTKVQPLMMNSCALAGCHSASDQTALQLARVRIGPRSSRLLTERNLAAALKYVNVDDADGSLLLSVPRGNHGRGGRPIFAGPKGDDHFHLLRGWVRQIAAESPAAAGSSPPGARRGAAADSGVVPSGFTIQPGRRVHPATGRIIGAPDPPGELTPPTRGLRPASAATGRAKERQQHDATGGDPLLQAILREERRDAFDPAEFNRQTTSRR